MKPTIVADDEKLYRSVDPLARDFEIIKGTLRVSANAFKDRDCQPSVDRSSMRANPADTRLRPSHAIIQIITTEVRQITNIRVAPTDEINTQTYGVDAIHRPILVSEHERENLAHCQIECVPAIRRNHFKKVKEALARLAEAHGLIVGAEPC